MTAKQDKERQKMLDELADEIDVTYGDVLILVGKRARLLNSIRNWTPREKHDKSTKNQTEIK